MSEAETDIVPVVKKKTKKKRFDLFHFLIGIYENEKGGNHSVPQSYENSIKNTLENLHKKVSEGASL